MGCGGSKESAQVAGPGIRTHQQNPEPGDRLQRNPQNAPVPLTSLPRVQGLPRQDQNNYGRSIQPYNSQTPGTYQSTGYDRQRRISFDSDDSNAYNRLWPRKASLPGLPIDVYVWHHLIPKTPEGDVPGWTYVTHGFHMFGRPEVIFTLKQRHNEDAEDFPFFPMEWVRVVNNFASMDTFMEQGQVCRIEFSDPVRFIINRKEVTGNIDPWKNNMQFTMFTHSFAKRPEIVVNLPPGVSISENCQIVIAFTPEETAVAMEFGPTRVIGQLGSSVAWFPEPRWIDRDRSSCCTMADQATSIRREIKIARIPGLNTLWVNDDITLTFPAGDTKKRIIQAAFRDLSTQHLFGFDCFMNENADCGLTWKAGQMKRPVGYGVSGGFGNHVNCAFISFADMQEEDKALVMEDGFTIFVRDETLAKIKQAVAAGEDLTVPLVNNMTFRIRWEQEFFLNPLDGRLYKGSMKITQPSKQGDPRAAFRPGGLGGPQGRADKPKTHVEIVTMFMHKEPGNDLIVSLIVYFEDILAVVREIVPPTPPRGVAQLCQRIVIDLQVPPPRGDPMPIFVHPSPAGIDLSRVKTAVQQVPLLLTTPPRGNEVLFRVQLVLGLWGYEGKDISFLQGG